MSEINLNNIHKVYFIGIRGVGMAALAQVLKAQGKEIIGSDTGEKFFTNDVLDDLDIKVYEGFSVKNIPNQVDLIVISAAYTESNNEEVKEVVKRELPRLSYSQVLGLLSQEKKSIGISGSHGKTTITAMLGLSLVEAKLDPTVILGTKVREFGSNARVGNSNLLLSETCEYKEQFLDYNPDIAVVTSLDWDHPDWYPTAESYKEAFAKYIKKIPSDGWAIVCGDDPELKEMAKFCAGGFKTYGFNDDNDYQAVDIKIANQILSATILDSNKNKLGEVELKIPGRHNILNAMAVIAVAERLGINFDQVKKSIANFQGTVRRFDVKGKLDNLTIIDDYAHHPTEIKSTLAGLKEFYPKARVLAVFHPHTFTRTSVLFNQFAESFADTEEVVVLDIYGSAREKQGGVSSIELVEAISKHGDNARYLSNQALAKKYILEHKDEFDIMITMGAGDVWKLGEELLANNINSEKK